MSQIPALLKRSAEGRSPTDALSEHVQNAFEPLESPRLPQCGIVGKSQAIQHVIDEAERVAPTDSIVLLLGESGTGKELLARCIHEMSHRSGGPLITLNCATLQGDLLDHELFGFDEGAFPDASHARPGRLELADRGTMVLQEIDALPLKTQAKLLQVLQDGMVERVGSTTTRRVNIRLIATSNHSLEELVASGSFREDLFYRINVFGIKVPPLRRRKGDIPALVATFVTELAEQTQKNITAIEQRSLDRLQKSNWPGNIRELRNTVERAMILSTGPVLVLDPPRRLRTGSSVDGFQTLNEVQRNHILDVLEETGWRIRGEMGAAEILDIRPTTLESRMKKLSIVRPNRLSGG